MRKSFSLESAYISSRALIIDGLINTMFGLGVNRSRGKMFSQTWHYSLCDNVRYTFARESCRQPEVYDTAIRGHQRHRTSVSLTDIWFPPCRMKTQILKVGKKGNFFLFFRTKAKHLSLHHVA